MEAERVRTGKLSRDEAALLSPLMMRLVRVSDGGNTTRRACRSDELTPELQTLAHKLCRDEFSHLLLFSRDTFEVGHEAIIRNWPWLQQEIATQAAALVQLENLRRRAIMWHSADATTRQSCLAAGFELFGYQELADKHHDWLSAVEREFIDQSTTGRRHVPSVRQSPTPRGSKVFIRNRRSDSSGFTGRIFDRLCREIPEDEIFYDVDSIPVSVDFRTHVRTAQNESAVLLLIIGPRWLSSFRSGLWRTMFGRGDDFVLDEVETAIELNIPIVPLLIEGTSMPTKSRLPTSINEISYIHAASIRGGRDFDTDMEDVLELIKGHRDRFTAREKSVSS